MVRKRYNGSMTEEDIRKISADEVRKCFKQLSDDIATVKASSNTMQRSINRIERILVGDPELEDDGYAKMIRFSYEHARRCVESKIVDRGENALKHFEAWENAGTWTILDDIVDKYKIIKWLTILIAGSGLISTINVLEIIINLLSKVQP